MSESTLTVKVVSSGKLVNLTTSSDRLSVKTDSKTVNIPIRQVIQVNYVEDNHVVHVSYVLKKKSKSPYSLVRIEGKVQGKPSAASEWATLLNKAAYDDLGVKSGRRLKVIVNPHGGVRKGTAIFSKTVEPVLRAAGCILDIQYTTHTGHAYEISKNLSLDYDAVVSVSGDGLIHEILNGFAHHAHPMKALALSIAPIPTGSGNGLALNILGLQDGFDVVCAALNVVKGFPMKVDVCSFVQNEKRTISFMSQAIGLMADLDIGTENLRWMGDTRFIVGFLRGLVTFKPCPLEFSYLPESEDKDAMAQRYRDRQTNDRSGTAPLSKDDSNDAFPPLRMDHDFDKWITFKEPLLYLYGGKGPYVGRDLMAFPASLPDDGLIDIAAQVPSSRADILGGISSTGAHFWNDSYHYIKAHAYRVNPLAPHGALSVDGESFPYQPFYVEVHQKLATLLSPYGYYAAEFPPK